MRSSYALHPRLKKMIRLYQGNGSGELNFVSHVENTNWIKYKLLTVRLLRAQGKIAAADILEQYPFALHEGTNFFGDEFYYLVAVFRPEEYVTVAEKESAPERAFIFRSIADALTEVGPYFIRFIIFDIDRDEEIPKLVEPPALPTSAENVNDALADAEELLRSRSASSAVDRLHTAFHGYLQEQCRNLGVSYSSADSITTLFKNIRANHPQLREEISRHEEIKRICNSLASIIDSLNPIRNHLSRAHPNEIIIAEDEAFLVINIIRSLFHYLNAKL